MCSRTCSQASLIPFWEAGSYCSVCSYSAAGFCERFSSSVTTLIQRNGTEKTNARTVYLPPIVTKTRISKYGIQLVIQMSNFTMWMQTVKKATGKDYTRDR